MPFLLCGVLGFVIPVGLCAQARRVGDLDSDGRLTVLDLGRLNGYLRGRPEAIPGEERPYADVNEDGAVDGADAAILAEAVVGRRRLPSPIRAPEVAGVESGADGTRVTVGGVVPAGRWMIIDGGAAQVVVTNTANGRFSAVIPLMTNRLNRLFLTATSSVFGLSAPRVIEVIHDGEPPVLRIDYPVDGSVVTTSNIAVGGWVSDRLSGHQDIDVTVNDDPAKVDLGNGGIGTFALGNIPLRLGLNTVVVRARDDAGNASMQRVAVRRVEPSGPRLTSVDGDGQIAEVKARLARPVVVRLTQENGVTPMAGAVVTFEVIRSDGRLKPVDPSRATGPRDDQVDATPDGVMRLQILTDASGEAGVWWTVGADAGWGNHRLQASCRESSVPAFFCASSRPGPARQINVGSGNHQRSEAGGPAIESIRAWVSDGVNGVEGVPVTFRVRQGGATLDGQTTLTAVTSRTGHAEVFATLGPEPGVNVIEATFPNQPGLPAAFVLNGVGRDAGRTTRLEAWILDNAHQPIGGAECRLSVNGAVLSSISDAQGRLVFTNAPPGPGVLRVDGATATRLNGATISSGSYPALELPVVLIPSATNALPRPVVLPRLNPVNARAWDGTNDIELTCAGVAGLKLTVRAGSMRKRDGTRVTPQNPVVLSLNPMRRPDVSIGLPDGAAPLLAWTLQPDGAQFDPPVTVECPNTIGQPAGAVARIFSLDPAIERFATAAIGQVVSGDGALVATELGTGLPRSGVGFMCPPYPRTGECDGGGDDEARPDGGSPAGNSDVLDESWTLLLDGQVSWVEAGGRFRVRDIPVLDASGAAGPENEADGVGDDYVRLIGFSNRGDRVKYVFSDFLRVRQDQRIPISGLRIADSPPRGPEGVSVATPVSGSDLFIGDSVPLTVTARYSDGASSNRTSPLAGTSYRTSNRNVATVDDDGRVTGVGSGVASITAVNNGIAAVVRLNVRARAPEMIRQPESQIAFEGGSVTFAVTASAAPAPAFQWYKDGQVLPGQTNTALVLKRLTARDGGAYFVVISNVAGMVTSAVANLTVLPVVPLGDALDDVGLTWTAGGSAAWFGQTLVSHDGIDAALSGPILDSQESWFQTAVTGPGTVTFWWKVSSEASFDFLRFTVDGVEQARISGERDWASRTHAVPAGTHLLRWRYTKDGSESAGIDAGWVDQILFTP